MNDQLFMSEFMPETLKIRKPVEVVKRPDVQNGMPFQGCVIIDGTPVDFYGSETGWHKFKSSVEAISNENF